MKLAFILPFLALGAPAQSDDNLVVCKQLQEERKMLKAFKQDWRSAHDKWQAELLPRIQNGDKKSLKEYRAGSEARDRVVEILQKQIEEIADSFLVVWVC